jgi:hypothetical protein
MAQTSALHREWARKGAMTRLQEIDREKQAIFSSFPELRRSSGRSGASAGEPRKRRKMSAAARRRMAAGMRRYWAKRKAEGK